MTREALAVKTGVASSSISRFLYGEGEVNLRALLLILEVLKLELWKIAKPVKKVTVVATTPSQPASIFNHESFDKSIFSHKSVNTDKEEA